MQRLRIIFAKTAAMKFTGHLDLHKTWERTLRRAGLPLAYSHGFNPQPKIQLACALPLGFTSECEIVDVWMEAAQVPADVRSALERAVAPGITLIDVAEVPESGAALQTQVASAEFRVNVLADIPPSTLDERITELLAAPEIKRVRRDKTYDLRPLVQALGRTVSEGESHTLTMHLAAREGATGRPEEVVAALGCDPARATYHRTRLALAEPVPD